MPDPDRDVKDPGCQPLISSAKGRLDGRYSVDETAPLQFHEFVFLPSPFQGLRIQPDTVFLLAEDLENCSLQ